MAIKLSKEGTPSCTFLLYYILELTGLGLNLIVQFSWLLLHQFAQISNHLINYIMGFLQLFQADWQLTLIILLYLWALLILFRWAVNRYSNVFDFWITLNKGFFLLEKLSSVLNAIFNIMNFLKVVLLDIDIVIWNTRTRWESCCFNVNLSTRKKWI